MESDVLLRILLILAIVIDAVATIYAFTLIRRTKYNSIWILCLVGFTVMTVERCCQMALLNGIRLDVSLFVFFGFAISIFISVAVLLANRLVEYLDRVDLQRQMFNRRILTAVLRTEERSRLNFAKELHDGLGPLLSSAKMSLSALSHDGISEEQVAILRNTAYVIDEAIRSVREISNNMSPQVLNDFGLAQGVKNFISRSVSLHGVEISYKTNLRAERFDNDVEVIIYRIICELINNSLKHSGCSLITLTLNFNGKRLRLEYADNGKGFNPQAVADCGMGLSNIASRVNSLNGVYEIASRNGEGMRAVVAVDVDKAPSVAQIKK